VSDEGIGAPPVVALDGSCALTPEQTGGKAWVVNRMRALGLPRYSGRRSLIPGQASATAARPR